MERQDDSERDKPEYFVKYFWYYGDIRVPVVEGDLHYPQLLLEDVLCGKMPVVEAKLPGDLTVFDFIANMGEHYYEGCEECSKRVEDRYKKPRRYE